MNDLNDSNELKELKDNFILNFLLSIAQGMIFLFSVPSVFFNDTNYIYFNILKPKYDAFALGIYVLIIISIPIISFIFSVMLYFILSIKKPHMTKQIMTSINLINLLMLPFMIFLYRMIDLICLQ